MDLWIDSVLTINIVCKCTWIVSYVLQILCLQEVEEHHYEDTFLPHLRQHGELLNGSDFLNIICCPSLGFDGVYQKRTGTYTDGCAIFYRCALFELLEYKKVQYFNVDKCPLLNRHNVGLVVKLRAKEGRTTYKQELDCKRQLCVATTHLLFNPKAGDVKLAQVVMLMAELHRMCQAPDETQCAAILCGDFNCLPNSPLQLFITNSELQYEGLCAADIAGYSRRRNRKLPVPLLSPRLGIADNCMFVSEMSPSDGKDQATLCSGQQDTKPIIDLTNGLNDKAPLIDLTMNNDMPSLDKTLPVIDLTTDTGTPRATTEADQEAVTAPKATLSHGFKFESVYKVVEGVQPASVTTFHCSAMEMVDFIYFTPAGLVQCNNSSSLQLLSRCTLPSTSTLMELGPLPNEFLPSDHLHLQAQFQLLTH